MQPHHQELPPPSPPSSSARDEQASRQTIRLGEVPSAAARSRQHSGRGIISPFVLSTSERAAFRADYTQQEIPWERTRPPPPPYGEGAASATRPTEWPGGHRAAQAYRAADVTPKAGTSHCHSTDEHNLEQTTKDRTDCLSALFVSFIASLGVRKHTRLALT